MTRLRRAIAALIAVPLALGLAACGSGEAEPNGLSGEPLAPIAAPAGTSWIDVAEATADDGYRVGNPDAPIKLMEFASHTCPACARFAAEAADPLREKYISTGVVSYELREQLHNPIDLMVAMLARCGQPESFHPLSEQVWSNLETVVGGAQANQAAMAQAQNLPPNQRFQQMAQVSGLLDFFSARGIVRDQALTCLADADKAQAIAERSDTQSEELDVTGTPTFFINGRKLDSVSNWAALEAELQKAGAR